MIAWTPAEDEALRAAYTRGCLPAARVALPNRSRNAIRRRAVELGVLKKRRWTAKDDEALRNEWGEGRSLETIARILGRTQLTVYWRAKLLGISGKPPPGFEYLHDASKRTGFDEAQLVRIMRWAGKRVRNIAAAPGPRKTTRRYRMVDWIEVEDAIAAWMKTETPEEAARRLGICSDRLRERLARIGVTNVGKKRMRVTEEQVAQANAIARWKCRNKSGLTRGVCSPRPGEDAAA